MELPRRTPFVIEEPGVPLKVWDDGSVRVGGTRGTVDVVLNAYNQGEPIEQIADDYGQLPREVIAAVVAYYQRHQEAVDAYLRDGERVGEALRAKIEAEHPTAELRRTLKERWAAMRAQVPD